MAYKAINNFYYDNSFYQAGQMVGIENPEIVKKLLDDGNIAETDGATPNVAPDGFPQEPPKDVNQGQEAVQPQPPLDESSTEPEAPAEPTEAQIQKDMEALQPESDPPSSADTTQINIS